MKKNNKMLFEVFNIKENRIATYDEVNKHIRINPYENGGIFEICELDNNGCAQNIGTNFRITLQIKNI